MCDFSMALHKITSPHFSFYFEAVRKLIIMNSSEFRLCNCITQHIILIYRLNVLDTCPINYTYFLYQYLIIDWFWRYWMFCIKWFVRYLITSFS